MCAAITLIFPLHN